jgi:hypothetical protein
MDTSKLQELLERLRLAEGPDRELDWSLFMLNPPPTFGGHYITRYAWEGGSVAVHLESGGSYQEAFSLPRYTASLEAALELVGRFYSQRIVRLETSGWAEITLPDGRRFEADHISGPAISVLVALLEAEIAEGSNHIRD